MAARRGRVVLVLCATLGGKKCRQIDKVCEINGTLGMFVPALPDPSRFPQRTLHFQGLGFFTSLLHQEAFKIGAGKPSKENASFLQWLWVGGEGIRGVSQGLKTQCVPVRHVRVPLSLNTGS